MRSIQPEYFFPAFFYFFVDNIYVRVYFMDIVNKGENMKRTKYGKNPNKTIYIAPNTQDEKDWKEVVDNATESGEGIGAILMECWRRVKRWNNEKSI